MPAWDLREIIETQVICHDEQGETKVQHIQLERQKQEVLAATLKV